MELDKQTIDDPSFASICSNVTYAMHATYHTKLQSTPAQVAYSRDMIINATYIANWKAIAARHVASTRTNNVRKNSNRLPFHYQVGDYAYIHVSYLARKTRLSRRSFSYCPSSCQWYSYYSAFTHHY
jgi:hypothetical protein